MDQLVGQDKAPVVGQDKAPEIRPNLRADDGRLLVYDRARGVYEPYERSKEAPHNHAETKSKKSAALLVNVRRDHVAFCVTTLISILTLGVVGTYTWYASRQTNASERATDATQQAVGVARDTLEHTKEQELAQAAIDKVTREKAQKATNDSARLAQRSIAATVDIARRDQRAWVVPFKWVRETDESGRFFRFKIQFRNTGKTPALKVQSETAESFLDSDIPGRDQRPISSVHFTLAPEADGQAYTGPSLFDESATAQIQKGRPFYVWGPSGMRTFLGDTTGLAFVNIPAKTS